MATPSVDTNSLTLDLREESRRREQVIRQVLKPVLSEQQILRAVMLCQKEFPATESFSTSRFCQRLVETIPGIQLSHETRLTLLRALRQTVFEQNVNRYTHALELPSEWLRSLPEQRPGGAAKAKPDASGGPAADVNQQDTGNESETQLHPMTEEAGESRQRPRERRLHPRKGVHLHGHYWAELDDTPTGDIVVVNLSLGGAGLRLLSPHALKNREHLPLEFTLDDNDATSILQNVQVRWIQGDLIGVSWLDKAAAKAILRAYLSL